ncbi:MAG TPA: serine/threonine-protein kinase [Methylomirabilota bacterium]|nr:serine/threonine-protein kinase [Methylomirabilota bacterium]
MSNAQNTQLRMAVCGRCKAKHFLPGNLSPLETVPCSHEGCGHPVILPTRIQHFELREIVASGGMGTVYRAFDLNLQRMVGIKMLKREMADDPQVLDGFYKEARATAALNHTNIIHIYSFDEFEGAPYIVMELADHGSLDQWIERDGFVPELNVLDVGIKMSSALESALQRNLLHRDIKPGNILFDEYGEPKLVDFGLAKNTEAADEYEAAIWGTPYYVAPEKIQRHGEDFLSDLYSLGGTLYHALTGHVPFEAETVEEVVAGHVHTPLTPPNLVRPEISQRTSDALVRAMAKHPQERFPSYGDFRMELEASRSELLVRTFQAQARAESRARASAKSAKSSWWKR